MKFRVQQCYISLQNITTCSYCRRYRQSTVYVRRLHTYRKRLSHVQHMISFFLNSFPLKNVSDLSATKLKSFILLPISIIFLLVDWYFKNCHFICLGFFLLKRPTWSRPSEAGFVPTEASKTFSNVTNRASVYTYLPYTVFGGLILLRLCRLWLQVTFQFF